MGSRVSEVPNELNDDKTAHANDVSKTVSSSAPCACQCQ